MPLHFTTHRRRLHFTRSGVTLIELLVVISIIGMLLALTLPAIMAARESARRAQCQNNLRQIVLATDSFHTSHNRYPYSQFLGEYGAGPDSRAWSWLARMLPFLERRDLHDLGGIPKQKLSESQATSHRVEIFICPTNYPGSGPRLDAGNLVGLPVGVTTYKGVSGANWGADAAFDESGQNPPPMFVTDWANPGTNGSYDGLADGDGVFFRTDYKVKRSKAHVRDGLSNTLLIGEDIPDLNAWCSWPYANNAFGTCAIPPNFECDASDFRNSWSFRSWHPGGLNFGLADGGVRFFQASIDLTVYRALATIRGSELLDEAEWKR